VPGDPSGEAAADEVATTILEAASAIFARSGPASVTVKWICLEAEVDPDEVLARWPDVPSVLGAVLDHIADQYDELVPLPESSHNMSRRIAIIDRYQRIVARALLDGVNPALLQRRFPVIDDLVARRVRHVDPNERTARYRISQLYALEWGWRLFGAHLTAVCGLEDLSDEELASQLLNLQRALGRTPGVEPPRRRAASDADQSETKFSQ
jgi:AcrR family transcriptional regulator